MRRSSGGGELKEKKYNYAMYALNSLRSYDYTSPFADPRLISAAHSGDRLLLDAPVRDGGVAMKDVPACRAGYAMNYPSLASIGGGDITYYYDAAIGRPFIKPLFDDSLVARLAYVDPMGAYKPHYYRDSDKVSGPGLTWLRDSQYQREDILARQIWRRNQTEPMYAY
jgi:hypothetical protein